MSVYKFGNSNKSILEKYSQVLIHAIFVILSICFVYPILIMISSSLSTENSIFTKGYSLIPGEFSLLAYKLIFSNPMFIVRAYLVTIGITICGTLLGLWLTATLGYVISKKDFVLKRSLALFVFFTMLFNGGLVPTYMLIVIWLGLKNNLLAMILPGLCSAWYVLLFKGFFSGIPDSMCESAKIDGAREFTIFTKIILPISKPALATVGLFLTLQYWNEWFNCMLYMGNEKLFTLQYLLVRLAQSVEFLNNQLASLINSATGGNLQVPTLSARFSLCVIAAGPMLFIFIFFQKFFIKGLTVGSVKG